MILTDTSVWIDFLAGRSSAQALKDLLLADQILCHPTVRGEIAMASIADRATVLSLLAQLPAVGVVSDDNAMGFVSANKLWGTGLGWVDAHLLACASDTRCKLWTRDRRLGLAAAKLGLAWKP